jgi:hypothetical protein
MTDGDPSAIPDVVNNVVLFLRDYSPWAAWTAGLYSIWQVLGGWRSRRRKRQISDRLSDLTMEANQLLLRSIGSELEHNRWKAEMETWLKKTNQYIKRNLPKVEWAQFNTMPMELPPGRKPFSESHAHDLAFLYPRFIKVRLMAGRWVEDPSTR